MELAAAILVQERLNPVAASPGGQTLLQSGEWARLASAVRLQLRENRCPALFSVPRQDSSTRWLMCLTPMLDPATGSNGTHLLLIFDPERSFTCAARLLQAVFNLTRAETRLVEQLLQGRRPAEAARELEVTIHTVRTYLKRLYGKLGVKSQAMLVQKLMRTVMMSTPPNP